MKQPKLFVRGDIDGFFGLMVDNLIQILVIVGLLQGLMNFPSEFLYKVILPGAAVSLLVGNIFYGIQAYRLMKREGRDDVTALPYGINTVSLFAFVFFVMFPVYLTTKDYKLAWKMGLSASLVSGFVEILGSFIAPFIRKHTPRAGLLSALSGIAITFISMDFLVRTFQNPLVAFVPLAILMLEYFGKTHFPFKIPGGLLSVAVGTGLAWMSGFWQEPMMSSKAVANSITFIGIQIPGFFFSEIVEILSPKFWEPYLSVILPMGLFNVIGSLQNIESAEASGDSYDTRSSLLANGFGTLAGVLCGSPFPTTIYIGHPGWKAMGARAGYSILNGVFISVVAFLGLMAFVSSIIPIEAGMGIVLWIGIVISAQCFQSIPSSHAPAAVIGIFPSLAAWAILMIKSIFFYLNMQFQGFIAKLSNPPKFNFALDSVSITQPIAPYALKGLLVLSEGFLLTSMVWASIVVYIIEKNFKVASIWAFIGAGLTFFGIIHSIKVVGNDVMSQYGILPATEFTISYILIGILFWTMSLGKKKLN